MRQIGSRAYPGTASQIVEGDFICFNIDGLKASPVSMNAQGGPDAFLERVRQVLDNWYGSTNCP